MASNDEAFQRELKAAFQAEAREQVQGLSLGLSKLESSELDVKQRMDIIEEIYRETHNLKGSARATNCLGMEAVCQGLESLFSMIKRGQLALNSEMLDPLHAGIDALGSVLAQDVLEEVGQRADTLHLAAVMLEDLYTSLTSTGAASPDQEADTLPIQIQSSADVSGNPATSADDITGDAKVQASASIKPNEHSSQQPTADTPADPAASARNVTVDAVGQAKTVQVDRRAPSTQTDTVRIAGSALDQLILQAEEMLSFKVRIKEQAQDIQKIVAITEMMTTEWSQLYPHIVQAHILLDQAAGAEKQSPIAPVLSRLIDYVDNNRQQMSLIDEQLNTVATLLSNDDRFASTTVDALLADTKNYC